MSLPLTDEAMRENLEISVCTSKNAPEVVYAVRRAVIYKEHNISSRPKRLSLTTPFSLQAQWLTLVGNCSKFFSKKSMKSLVLRLLSHGDGYSVGDVLHLRRTLKLTTN